MSYFTNLFLVMGTKCDFKVHRR